MDRLDELSVFLAVLDAGSLAAASRRLRRSAPAVTRVIATLETRMGVRLIERTTRKLAVTDAGRRLAEEARTVLAAYEAAVLRDAGETLRGPIRISAPVVFGRRHVAPLLARFLEDHPEVTADLVLNDRNLDLLDEGIDVAVRIGALADSSLVARRVGEVGRYVVASPAYLARSPKLARPADLDRHRIVYPSAQPGPPEWQFGGARAPEIVRLRPWLAVNAIEPLICAALDDQGVTRVFSYQVADEIADGRLVRLLQAFEPPPIPVQLLTVSTRLAPPRVRAFLDRSAAELSRLPVLRPEA